MKLVLTGAAGRIGRVLVDSLLKSGHDILAIDQRFEPAFRGRPGLRQYVLQLGQPGPVHELFDGAEALVHFGNIPNAGCGPARMVYRENVNANLETLQAAADVGIRKIVFASSIQVVQGTRRLGDEVQQPSGLAFLPMTGALPAQPSNHYGLSKLAGEDLLRMLCRLHADLMAVALRLPWTAGGPTPKHRLDPDHLPPGNWWGRHHLDEGFSFLDDAEVGPLVHAILDNGRPGYDCLLPASDDTQTGWPAEKLADRFFPGVPIRGELSGKFTLVDNTPITEAYGWRPADLSALREPPPPGRPTGA